MCEVFLFHIYTEAYPARSKPNFIPRQRPYCHFEKRGTSDEKSFEDSVVWRTRYFRAIQRDNFERFLLPPVVEMTNNVKKYPEACLGDSLL